jgi:hypothetical protein
VASGGRTTTPSYGLRKESAFTSNPGDLGAGIRRKYISAACPDGRFAAVWLLVSLTVRGGSEVSEYAHNIFTTKTPVTPGSDAARPQDTAITPSSGRVYMYVEHMGYLAGCR